MKNGNWNFSLMVCTGLLHFYAQRIYAEMIRKGAYEIFERRCHRNGDEIQDWLHAGESSITILRVTMSTESMETRLAPSTSPWVPLRHPLFRALWLANLCSGIGSTMNDTAAVWTMTTQTSSPLFGFR